MTLLGALDELIVVYKHLYGKHDQRTHAPHMRGIGIKEPWQMTKDEFEATSVVRSFDDIVDGEPIALRAFHGTRSPEEVKREGFEVPENESNPLVESIQSGFKKRQDIDKQGFLGRGVYFTDSKSIASNYGEPLEVDIRLNKPYVIRRGTIADMRSLDLDELRKEGYDGIVMLSGKYGLTGESYRQGIVFDPKKVSIASDGGRPIKLAKGALVERGDEVGEVRGISKLSDTAKDFWNDQGANFDSFVEVRWHAKKGRKARTEINLRDTDLTVQGGHKQLIKRALAGGLPVPDEVLADYPELKPQ